MFNSSVTFLSELDDLSLGQEKTICQHTTFCREWIHAVAGRKKCADSIKRGGVTLF